jgi:D-xylose transport system substrate-binding protein
MKTFSYIVAIFATLLFSGCTSTNSSIKAGFLVHTLQDERWSIERDAFTARFTELGGSVVFENANQDERNQYHIAKKLIEEENIKVLVIVPVNSKTAASIVRLCHDNNVKVIAYDIIIENSDLDLFVSFDNEKVGELMAQYATTRIPKGNYVLLWGDSDMKITHWIKDGQMKVLEPYLKSGDISIAYQSFVENWSGINSAQIMKRVIDFSDDPVDAIIASADGIAQGVIDAYHSRDIGNIPLLTGQDASTEAIENIRKNTQTMTIKKPFDKLAVQAADCAFQMANSKKIKTDTELFNGYKNVASILLEPSVVDIKSIK